MVETTFEFRGSASFYLDRPKSATGQFKHKVDLSTCSGSIETGVCAAGGCRTRCIIMLAIYP